MKDSFYTPDYLAKLLVNYAKNTTVKSVVDFCVGEGELLKAAFQKWPDSDLYGTDISIEIINKLNKEHPDWKIEYCDFVDENSRNQCSVLKKQFDIILLNPPFTCKGATISTVVFDNKIFKMSTAMSFFVTSLTYLKTGGEIYAILPQSVAYSEKDSIIWQYLSDFYSLRILEERHNKDFRQCTPNTILVNLIKKKNKAPIILKTDTYNLTQFLPNPVRIIRGSISMHLKEKYAYGEMKLPLIHTTNLQNHSISNITYFIRSEHSVVKGPALLIPRVGNYSQHKITMINTGEKYSISDCIIALEYKDINECCKLFDYIINNWPTFVQIYKGTGAKYTTIKRIHDFFGFIQP